ncbi:MAG TPA: LysM domain-containing protein, partial [Chloroflexi bacterium]|nr:LysM domain-containing protein [Chloroflexota bacterium]
MSNRLPSSSRFTQMLIGAALVAVMLVTILAALLMNYQDIGLQKVPLVRLATPTPSATFTSLPPTASPTLTPPPTPTPTPIPPPLPSPTPFIVTEPTPTPFCPAPPGWSVYIVKQGDTLASIAW